MLHQYKKEHTQSSANSWVPSPLFKANKYFIYTVETFNAIAAHNEIFPSDKLQACLLSRAELHGTLLLLFIYRNIHITCFMWVRLNLKMCIPEHQCLIKNHDHKSSVTRQIHSFKITWITVYMHTEEGLLLKTWVRIKVKVWQGVLSYLENCLASSSCPTWFHYPAYLCSSLPEIRPEVVAVTMKDFIHCAVC